MLQSLYTQWISCDYVKGDASMIKKLYIFLICSCMLILCGCARLQHEEELTKWDCSVPCVEESTEDSFVINYCDIKFASSTGVLTFQNHNDFDIIVYLLNGGEHDRVIEISAGGCSVQYDIDKNTEFTVGIHADVEADTEIKLMVYDGEATEVYSE